MCLKTYRRAENEATNKSYDPIEEVRWAGIRSKKVPPHHVCRIEVKVTLHQEVKGSTVIIEDPAPRQFPGGLLVKTGVLSIQKGKTDTIGAEVRNETSHDVWI
ncbi:hypothetical protein FKM82_030878 [Ascaphus truei]